MTLQSSSNVMAHMAGSHRMIVLPGGENSVGISGGLPMLLPKLRMVQSRKFVVGGRSSCLQQQTQSRHSGSQGRLRVLCSLNDALSTSGPPVYQGVYGPLSVEAEDVREGLDLEGLNDQQLEDLFENYSEVVKEESVPTPTSSEVDDDAESLALAVALAEVANDVKASEIQVLCVKPLVYWTSFFVIATGFSRPQVDAIGQRMRTMAEERFKRIPQGDLKPNAWTLLDFGDVVVHIFYPKERSFYNLEEFYGNAIRVELPFESQSISKRSDGENTY